MNTPLQLFLNPFKRIAGYRALLWGFLGIIISAVLGWLSGINMNGLFQFGVFPENIFWIHLGEFLILWLIPVILFYIAGLLLSKSRIRFIDVLGTVAFAQLPFILINLLFFTGPVQQMKEAGNIMVPSFSFLIVLLAAIILMIWTVIWMYQAFKVSCNLKGIKLGGSFIVAILASHILTCIAIGALRNIILTGILAATPQTEVLYVPDQYMEVTRQFSEDYNNNRFKDAYVIFSPEMQRSISENKTVALLSNLKKRGGAITSWQIVRSGQAHTTYRVKLQTSGMNLQISIDTLARISGLYIVP